jgi:NitT/TauT family transport system substrate-binding protein
MFSQSSARKYISITIAAAMFAVFLPTAASPAPRTFKLAWSIYTGYMPWLYAERSGILKRWADKYGIRIELVQVNDYVESINQYTAGQYDAVTDTNMDSLTIPAAGGVDTTAIILGDYSNGNDAIFIKGRGKTLVDLKGQKVHLVQYSVSHYMLWRALQKAGLKETDVVTANISDADFVTAFGTPEITAEVVWNPATTQIQKMPNVTSVFDSSQIPRELQDVVVVNTAVLRKAPQFAKALVGAWYEALAVMQRNDQRGIDARTMMASASGTTLADFDDQVKTTQFYYSPAEAAAFFRSAEMMTITEQVMMFSFEHGLLGKDAKSKDAIGIELPGGHVLGDKSNIRLRFDPTYMEMAASGKL